MTDKDERMKDAVAELRFASDGIVNMLAANLTPKESFMRDLAADLSYAASAIASQASEIAALKAHLKQGRELADELEGLMGETWIVNHELYDIVAHLHGDTP